MIAAGSFVALAGVAGAAVDLGVLKRQKDLLQSIADSAAISGARELKVASIDADQAQASALIYIKTLVANTNKIEGKVTQSAIVNTKEKSVKIEITQHWKPFFADLIYSGVTPITVTAIARITGSDNVCVLGLGPKIPKTIFLDHDAKITGKNCSVYSNSTDKDAIRADSNGRIVASSICSAGGSTGSKTAFSPGITHDCPKFVDPLAARPEPSVGSCTHKNLEIKDQVRTLTPGIYCEGLKIAGDARVTFSPGVYVIKGAKFHVQDKAEIKGTNVGFYLADENALFEFTEDTSITLSAPKSGPMAGILFFDTRSASVGRKHRINSNNAKKLIGTFYLPKSTLLVDSKAPVAAESAFTAVIAYAIELLEQPNLVLNTDYSSTDIPPPQSMAGGSIVLTK